MDQCTDTTDGGRVVRRERLNLYSLEFRSSVGEDGKQPFFSSRTDGGANGVSLLKKLVYDVGADVPCCTSDLGTLG